MKKIIDFTRNENDNIVLLFEGGGTQEHKRITIYELDLLKTRYNSVAFDEVNEKVYIYKDSEYNQQIGATKKRLEEVKNLTDELEKNGIDYCLMNNELDFILIDEYGQSGYNFNIFDYSIDIDEIIEQINKNA